MDKKRAHDFTEMRRQLHEAVDGADNEILGRLYNAARVITALKPEQAQEAPEKPTARRDSGIKMDAETLLFVAKKITGE